MERAQNPASSMGSPEDVSDTFTYSSSDTGVLIPVQLATLNILASCFKEGPKSTNIEQALIKDPVFSGFMEDYLNQGTELLTEHDAIFRFLSFLKLPYVHASVKGLKPQGFLKTGTTINPPPLFSKAVRKTAVKSIPFYGGSRKTAVRSLTF
ncbi:hypothetical protein PHJA_001287500 [Phtheirospermum japonicum]|uniref:Uncharacterized protein n=1 Tax=Phtheirospermum japonicum TaxID=374723 RepID=A0A830C814_9LAMI|nr:hypothetical protein PHJA_001287500 [Phtheirospermum japonicum]